MFTLSFLLLVAFVGSVLYLGASLVFAIVALAFKALWMGVSFIFSMGWLAVVAVAAGIVLLVKLSGLFVMVALVAAVLWVFWMLGRLLGGSRRSSGPAPAASYACEPPRGGAGCGWSPGGSKREETISRIHRTLNKMERRMRDLEEEMDRRWR